MLIIGATPGWASVKDSSFQLNGQLEEGADQLIVLARIELDQLQIVDSVRADKKGRFTFYGKEENSTIYYLMVNKTTPPGVPLVLEGGAKVDLKLEDSQYFPYTVNGGKYNADMKELRDLYTKYDVMMNALNKEAESLDPTVVTEELKRDITNRYNTILSARLDDVAKFIKTHEGSPVTFFAVRFLFSRPEARLITLASEKMVISMSESGYTRQIVQIKESLGEVYEGAIAPEIKLKNPQGDTVSLHSLRGKVVLIDFWASWCGPCRKENPYVKEIYHKYKDQGFEIYGVSLDNNAKQWTTAILQDGISWLHVSELKGWSTSAAKKYGVSSIPQTFLLDKEGRIYKVGLRSLELEAEIVKLLEK